IDHGMGVVIGETTEIGDDVMLYHGVTLGGLSSERVKRHPTLENGVTVGAGAKVLGPVRIGRNAKVGANAVVNRDVAPDTVVVGIPARPVGQRESERVTVIEIPHTALPDLLCEQLDALHTRLHAA